MQSEQQRVLLPAQSNNLSKAKTSLSEMEPKERQRVVGDRASYDKFFSTGKSRDFTNRKASEVHCHLRLLPCLSSRAVGELARGAIPGGVRAAISLFARRGRVSLSVMCAWAATQPQRALVPSIDRPMSPRTNLAIPLSLR